MFFDICVDKLIQMNYFIVNWIFVSSEVRVGPMRPKTVVVDLLGNEAKLRCGMALSAIISAFA